MGQEIDFIVYHKKASEFFWKNKYYPTNKKLRFDVGEAVRIARCFTHTEFIYDPSIEKKYDPSLFRDSKMYGFIGDADVESGFGNCTVNLIKYSVDDGYDVRWMGRTQARTIKQLSESGIKEVPDGIGVVWHEQPKKTWMSSPFKKNIALVPFETTRIPGSWVPEINSFDALLCISKQNIQMMRDSGITIPIELIHWGTDTRKFSPINRIDDGIFTFGTMGALSVRKGTDLLVRAFQAAFPPRVQNVRLLCKSSHTYYHFAVKDTRIQVELSPWDHEELMKRFFGKVDCFVFPTRGEGWGLPCTESMATGIPVIATGWSGPMEFMNDDVGWTLKYSLAPAKEFSDKVYSEDCGDWAEPDFDDLVDKMRYAYEHQDEVKQKGQNAIKHIQENFTWEKVLPMYYNALKKHL